MSERGIRGGRGRIQQVKAAVTADEKTIFEDLAKNYYGKRPCTVSHIIRAELIKIAIAHKLLPKDYDLD
ncbi:MAG: hypothetical protein CME17_04020 [Gemmatimonadetes bacterium]|nr:hypothetical protein [Gemmatimonadota bacterium]